MEAGALIACPLNRIVEKPCALQSTGLLAFVVSPREYRAEVPRAETTP
jgi:hypothetical protein